MQLAEVGTNDCLAVSSQLHDAGVCMMIEVVFHEASS
jgi:hypothetical protein